MFRFAFRWVRRLTWFGLGAGAGVATMVKLRKTADQYAPVRVAKRAGAKVKGAGTNVREALGEGKAAMREREAELQSELRQPSGPDIR